MKRNNILFVIISNVHTCKKNVMFFKNFHSETECHYAFHLGGLGRNYEFICPKYFVHMNSHSQNATQCVRKRATSW